MDISKLLTDLFAGNNGILLLVAFFLFKDQILALFQKPVVTPPVVVPVVPPVPDPAPIIVPPDHPLVDVFIKQILPVLLPILINTIKLSEPPK